MVHVTGMVQTSRSVVTPPAVGAGKITQAVFLRQLVPVQDKLVLDAAVVVQAVAVDAQQQLLFLIYKLTAVPGHKLPALQLLPVPLLNLAHNQILEVHGVGADWVLPALHVSKLFIRLLQVRLQQPILILAGPKVHRLSQLTFQAAVAAAQAAVLAEDLVEQQTSRLVSISI